MLVIKFRSAKKISKIKKNKIDLEFYETPGEEFL